MLWSVLSYAGAVGTFHDSLLSWSHWQSEFQMRCLLAGTMGARRCEYLYSLLPADNSQALDILFPVDTDHHTPGLGHNQPLFNVPGSNFVLSEEISTWVQLDICSIDLATLLSLSPLG